MKTRSRTVSRIVRLKAPSTSKNKVLQKKSSTASRKIRQQPRLKPLRILSLEEWAGEFDPPNNPDLATMELHLSLLPTGIFPSRKKEFDPVAEERESEMAVHARFARGVDDILKKYPRIKPPKGLSEDDLLRWKAFFGFSLSHGDKPRQAKAFADLELELWKNPDMH